MRALIAAAGLAVLLAGAAHADTLGVIKENTLVLTDAKGVATAFLLADDGTFEQSTATGEKTGKWTLHDTGQFCWQAEGVSYQQCLPVFPADKAVGDEWEVKAPNGAVSYTAKIVEGRVKLNGRE